jgi:hypothetical protein
MKWAGLAENTGQICMKAKFQIHNSKWFRNEEVLSCILLYTVIDTLWVE